MLRRQILDLGGEVEVFLGDSAGVVGDESEADAVVADVYVGVVAGFFGEFADPIDEAERGDEAFELEGADEFAGFNLPAGKLGEAGLSGFGGKDGHGGSSLFGFYETSSAGESVFVLSGRVPSVWKS